MRSRSQPTNAYQFAAVALADVKNFLRIDDTNDDVLLAALTTAAVSQVESYIDTKIVEREYDIYFDRFPSTLGAPLNIPDYDPALDALINGGADPIKLPFGNLQSVDALTTYADDDAPVVFDPSNYNVDLIDGRIRLKQSQVWPSTILRTLNGIKISVTAGYANAGSIPEDIKQAILLIIAKLYEHRGDDKDNDMDFALPFTAATLLAPYRRYKASGL